MTDKGVGLRKPKETSFWGRFLNIIKIPTLVLGFLAIALLLTGCDPSVQSQQTTQTPQATPSPSIEVKTETKEEPVSFETKEEQTSALAKGATQVKQEGKDGKEVITYEVTYTDGKETSRKQTKEEVIEQPQAKIILVGIYVAPTNNNSSGSISNGSCGNGYYKNVDGNCIKSPGSDSSGATAKCRDGSYSYSQHRQGTCSGHGGVAQWL